MIAAIRRWLRRYLTCHFLDHEWETAPVRDGERWHWDGTLWRCRWCHQRKQTTKWWEDPATGTRWRLRSE